MKRLLEAIDVKWCQGGKMDEKYLLATGVLSDGWRCHAAQQKLVKIATGHSRFGKVGSGYVLAFAYEDASTQFNAEFNHNHCVSL